MPVWRWVGRWHTVLRQWAEVEAEMGKAYGLSVRDIFRMTWRRFTVLFGGVFNWQDAQGEDPDAAATPRIADTVEWEKGLKDAPNLLEEFRGVQVPVGKGA